MFSYFENLLKPFPAELPTRPPATLFAFCWHYSRGAWPWIFLMSLLITLVAAIEVILYGFFGQIIDWLTQADKAAFLEREGDTLIFIAAVVLLALPILVLDEATSALDSEVEAAIQENLMQLMEGKTVIAIAHRLSTISALDRLVVIEQGRIVQQGSHQLLSNSVGLYADLWKRQSGGFIE